MSNSTLRISLYLIACYLQIPVEPSGLSQLRPGQHDSSPELPHRTFSDAQAVWISPGRGVICCSVSVPCVRDARRVVKVEVSEAMAGVRQTTVQAMSAASILFIFDPPQKSHYRETWKHTMKHYHKESPPDVQTKSSAIACTIQDLCTSSPSLIRKRFSCA